MRICIVYDSKNQIAGLWINIERGKKAAEEIGGWYQIRHTIDKLK